MNAFMTCPGLSTPFQTIKTQKLRSEQKQLKKRIQVLTKKIPQMKYYQQNNQMSQTLMNLTFKLKQKTLDEFNFKNIMNQVRAFQKSSQKFGKDDWKKNSQLNTLCQSKTNYRANQTTIKHDDDEEEVYRKAILQEIQYRRLKTLALNNSKIIQNVAKQLNKKLEKTKALNKKVQQIFHKQKDKQISLLNDFQNTFQIQTQTKSKINKSHQKKPSKLLHSEWQSTPKSYNQQFMLTKQQINEKQLLLKSKKTIKDIKSVKIIRQSIKNNKDDIIMFKANDENIFLSSKNPKNNQNRKITRSQMTLGKSQRAKQRRQHLQKCSEAMKIQNLIKKQTKIEIIATKHCQKSKELKKKQDKSKITGILIEIDENKDKNIQNKIQSKIQNKKVFLQNKVNRIKQNLNKQEERRQNHKQKIQANKFWQSCIPNTIITNKLKSKGDCRHFRIHQRHQSNVKRQQLKQKIVKLRQLSLNELERKLNRATNSNFFF